MADWTHLQRDASTDGGLLQWPIETTESRDRIFALPGILTDDNNDPYDFTQITEPVVAEVFDPETEEQLATLGWVGHADGSFEFTLDRLDAAATAGDPMVYPNGRPLQWAAELVIPGGYHVQLVEISPFLVRHKGV